jgi:hypothetical protein
MLSDAAHDVAVGKVRGERLQWSSMSCAVVLTRVPIWTWRTPRPATRTFLPFKVTAELRAMTKSCETFDRAVMMSSEMPSAKHSGLPLILANGRAATDGLSGNAERPRSLSSDLDSSGGASLEKPGRLAANHAHRFAINKPSPGRELDQAQARSALLVRHH